jgi:predicted DNA-binding protein YlxM (UPF0122 family)
MAIVKVINIPLLSIGRVEHMLSSNGFSHYSIYITEDHKALINFYDEIEYSIFVLKDLLKKSSVEVFPIENSADFVLKFEKKLKIYKKSDSYVIEQIAKGA